MIKIENAEIVGWEAAIRGMRSPMNSWDKSDSFPCIGCKGCEPGQECERYNDGTFIGPNDLDLMMRLRNAGTDHRKFMRMITVYIDIVAPLYWWKEFDTYKVGTVADSCSTMHKIQAKEFMLDDFSHEHLLSGKGFQYVYDDSDKEIDLHLRLASYQLLELTVNTLNYYRKAFLETNNKKYWWQMIQLLPSSYNQRRTIMLNYEVLANIYKSRRNHKLDEWHTFCEWIENLPYSELITGKVEEN